MKIVNDKSNTEDESIDIITENSRLYAEMAAGFTSIVNEELASFPKYAVDVETLDVNLKNILMGFYGHDMIEKRVLGSVINAIVNQKLGTFMLSKRILIDLVKNDPNFKGKTISSSTYKKVMINNVGLFLDKIRTHSFKKAAIYTVKLPELLSILYRFNDASYYKMQKDLVLEIDESNEIVESDEIKKENVKKPKVKKENKDTPCEKIIKSIELLDLTNSYDLNVEETIISIVDRAIELFELTHKEAAEDFGIPIVIKKKLFSIESAKTGDEKAIRRSKLVEVEKYYSKLVEKIK